MANTKSRTLLRPRVIETETTSATACGRCGASAPSCAACTTWRAIRRCAAGPPASRGWRASSSASRSRWPARPPSGTRTAMACRPFEPAVLLALKDKHLAGAGLSRPKIRTLRAISEACSNGLDLTRLDRASDEEVHAALTAVTGIGPWTADVYIMFCLGRADGWAPGDLALQIAAQHALELDERPGQGGDAGARRALAPLARRRRPPAVGLLRRPQGASAPPCRCEGVAATAQLDGPRLEPRGRAAGALVVLLHGYGANGDDLIALGDGWRQWLPDAAFVAPNAPQTIPGMDGGLAVVRADAARSQRILARRRGGAAGARPLSRCRAGALPPRRRTGSCWSASARAP